MSRGDLTDGEWRIFDPLLPDRGERGPPIQDKRRTVNGILWVLRTGAPWRDIPRRYGNWNSVFVRFTRWSRLGVWDARCWRALDLPPTRNMPSIPRSCGRTSMQPAQKGESKTRSARPLARRLLDQNPPPHECQRRPADLRYYGRRGSRDARLRRAHGASRRASRQASRRQGRRQR